MKIELKFEKENIYRLLMALVFAGVFYVWADFPLYVLLVFGALYFFIKSLHIELKEKFAWLWTAIMFVCSSIFTTYHIQYLLLDIFVWKICAEDFGQR